MTDFGDILIYSGFILIGIGLFGMLFTDTEEFTFFGVSIYGTLFMVVGVLYHVGISEETKERGE